MLYYGTYHKLFWVTLVYWLCVDYPCFQLAGHTAFQDFWQHLLEKMSQIRSLQWGIENTAPRSCGESKLIQMEKKMPLPDANMQVFSHTATYVIYSFTHLLAKEHAHLDVYVCRSKANVNIFLYHILHLLLCKYDGVMISNVCLTKLIFRQCKITK